MHFPSSRAALCGATALTLAVGGLIAAGPAAAHGRQHSDRGHHGDRRTVYVSAPAATTTPAAHRAGHRRDHRRGCDSADFTAIQDAIEAVPYGGTVVVCRGSYPGLVTVDRSITLAGQYGATIDATGQPYGVGVTASHVTITGLRVINASDTANGPADGILTAGFGATGPVPADHVRIVGNETSGNLGAGIDLNSTSYSVAAGNNSHDNGIGVNVSDDLGAPATHNLIVGNRTNRNFGGCGIALADHSGLGVNDNLVAHNVANDNGLSTPTAPDASAGSGVILASPIPGGMVRGNVIVGNRFDGNGHGGVVVHSHAPGSDFSGNVVVGNRIGTNNLRTDTSDAETTGIYIGSVEPLAITVRCNVIGPDHFGVFTAGAVTLSGGGNRYRHVDVPVSSVDTYGSAG
jgi:nitrous oxidase accessory protein NosD